MTDIVDREQVSFTRVSVIKHQSCIVINHDVRSGVDRRVPDSDISMPEPTSIAVVRYTSQVRVQVQRCSVRKITIHAYSN